MTYTTHQYSKINRLDALPIKSFKELLAYANTVEFDTIILVCEYDFPLPADRWQEYMGYLPAPLQRDVMRYRKWEDRHNNLFGKLLIYLSYYLTRRESLDFKTYKRTHMGKPFLEGLDFDFNISHSKKIVVAVHHPEELGVDIEFIQDMDFTYFESVLNKDEMEMVKSEGMQKFFEFWTSKEAISKALGEGLNIDVAKISCNEETVVYHNQSWPLLKFIYKDHFFLTIASKLPITNSTILRIKF